MHAVLESINILSWEKKYLHTWCLLANNFKRLTILFWEGEWSCLVSPPWDHSEWISWCLTACAIFWSMQKLLMPKHYCFSSLMPKLSLRGSIYSTAEGQISHQIYCGMLLCAFFFCSLSFMDAYLLTKWAKIRRIFTSWSSQDNKNIKIIRFCFCVLELSLACWNIIFAIPLTCMHH